MHQHAPTTGAFLTFRRVRRYNFFYQRRVSSCDRPGLDPPDLALRPAASRRHVDASLDLFARNIPRSWRDLAEKRALSARRLFFLWVVGV